MYTYVFTYIPTLPNSPSPHKLHMASPDNVSAGTYRGCTRQVTYTHHTLPLFTLQLIFLLCNLAGGRQHLGKVLPESFKYFKHSAWAISNGRQTTLQASEGWKLPASPEPGVSKVQEDKLRGQRSAEQGDPLPFIGWVALWRETQDGGLVGFIDSPSNFWKAETASGRRSSRCSWGTVLAELGTTQIPPCFWHIRNEKAEGPIYTLKWTVSRWATRHS